MDNKQKKDNTHNENTYDYRFLDYRLNQYETKLDKGLEKLEEGQQNNYTEIMKTLRIMQEGNNEQNKQLVEISQRQQSMEEKMKCIDKLKEVATSHKEQINNLYNRIDVYKQILFLIGGTAISAFLMAILELILK